MFILTSFNKTAKPIEKTKPKVKLIKLIAKVLRTTRKSLDQQTTFGNFQVQSILDQKDQYQDGILESHQPAR